MTRAREKDTLGHRCDSQRERVSQWERADVLVALIGLSVSTCGSAVRLLAVIMFEWIHSGWFIRRGQDVVTAG